MNVALVLAGGLGIRMNQDGEHPKQFFKLGDKPVLIHTLSYGLNFYRKAISAFLARRLAGQRIVNECK